MVRIPFANPSPIPLQTQPDFECLGSANSCRIHFYDQWLESASFRPVTLTRLL